MKYFAFLISWLFLLSSCSKEELSSKLTGEWEITAIRKAGTLGFIYAPKPYVVSFHDDGSMGFFADVNNCGSWIEVNDQGGFITEGLLCQLACCDSDFSNEIKFLLEDITTYQISNNILTLSGEGAIKLGK